MVERVPVGGIAFSDPTVKWFNLSTSHFVNIDNVEIEMETNVRWLQTAYEM